MGSLSSRIVVCAALVFASACGDNLRSAPELEIISSLDTTAPAQVLAGDIIPITCLLTENDGTGDIVTMVTGEVHVTAEDSVSRMGTSVVARKVGTITVHCALPDRDLVDETPVTVEILTGAAANIITTVTPDPVTAGGTVTATCEVFDSSGNPVTDASPTLQISPMDPGNTITDLTALMTRAGPYGARCELPGTTTNTDSFMVVPALPSTLLLAKVPDLPIYAIGDNVQITHIVTDRYGNEISDAIVDKTSANITGSGPTVSPQPDTFHYDSEGRYRVTGVVAPPTDGDVAVTATIDILVNSLGPRITCANDATMVNLAPGAPLTIQGMAADINGVTGLTVNGTATAIAMDGSFQTQVTSRFGINFVDVTATDNFGAATSMVCTFLVSDRWGNPADPIADTVSLKLTQAAIDDGDRNGAIDAFADVLHTVINSAGLRTAIHNALLAANPLKPTTCDSQTCTFFGCICWYRSGVTYINSMFNGPNNVSLTLVDGGLRANVRINNIALNLRVRGDVGGIPYDTMGWVRMAYVDVSLILDPAINNGLPRITVRPGSVSSNVGTISTEFNGVDGWIINNIVVPLAQGQLRETVRNLIQNFVTSNFNNVLDGLMANLNISTLGTTFNVPRIDGSGSVAMSFGVAFSSLNATASRLLFGIGTRLSTPPAHAIASLGVPLPPGASLLDASLSNPANTAVAVHVGLFNHALHALWRAGYFAATIDGSTLGSSFPAGISIVVDTRLPPVATISNTGVVQLHLGALDMTVQHPDLPPNLGVRLGADAHATVTLNGDDLQFGGIVLDQIYISTDIIAMTATEQMDLEMLLQTFAQQLIDQSLNNALPALPIPGFRLPAALGVYGLPVGEQLGLNAPALTVSPQHFVLRGQFGLKP